MTNRQIGEAMYLAEKTVKNYVSNVFAKLGMARRPKLPSTRSGCSATTTMTRAAILTSALGSMTGMVSGCHHMRPRSIRPADMSVPGALVTNVHRVG